MFFRSLARCVCARAYGGHCAAYGQPAKNDAAAAGETRVRVEKRGKSICRFIFFKRTFGEKKMGLEEKERGKERQTHLTDEIKHIHVINLDLFYFSFGSFFLLLLFFCCFLVWVEWGF